MHWDAQGWFLNIPKTPEVLRQTSVSVEELIVKQLQALSQLYKREVVWSIMEQRTVLGGKKNKASFGKCISQATRRLLTIEENLRDDVGKFLLVNYALSELLACDYFILNVNLKIKCTAVCHVWEVTLLVFMQEECTGSCIAFTPLGVLLVSVPHQTGCSLCPCLQGSRRGAWSQTSLLLSVMFSLCPV